MRRVTFGWGRRFRYEDEARSVGLGTIAGFGGLFSMTSQILLKISGVICTSRTPPSGRLNDSPIGARGAACPSGGAMMIVTGAGVTVALGLPRRSVRTSFKDSM